MNNRYAKYDFKNIRERPTDELEEQLAEEDADREAAQFLQRYGSSPNFRRRVVTKLAQRELLEKERSSAKRQEAFDDAAL